TNAEYLDNILAVRHGSVLEHAVWSLLFEGVSRALTHELVRHRHFSYSQLSQRYVDESDVAFVLPPEIEEGTPAFEIWKKSCERARPRAAPSPTRPRPRSSSPGTPARGATSSRCAAPPRPRPRSASSRSRCSRCCVPRRPTSSEITASSNSRTGSG